MRKYAITLALLGFTGIAAAQDMPAFEDADANSDGAVSQEEAAAIEGLDFAAHDADQDGSLTREEYEGSAAE